MGVTEYGKKFVVLVGGGVKGAEMECHIFDDEKEAESFADGVGFEFTEQDVYYHYS